jgi:hemerythrin
VAIDKDLVQWGPALELGISEIDAQHRSLVNLANKLHSALMKGKAEGEARSAVAELFAYSATHFADEEAYFVRYNVPNLDEHVAAHAAFVARAIEFEERLASGDPAQTAEMLGFLKAWIKRHIGREDRELVRVARRVAAHR